MTTIHRTIRRLARLCFTGAAACIGVAACTGKALDPTPAVSGKSAPTSTPASQSVSATASPQQTATTLSPSAVSPTPKPTLTPAPSTPLSGSPAQTTAAPVEDAGAPTTSGAVIPSTSLTASAPAGSNTVPSSASDTAPSSSTPPAFLLGADISSVQESNSTFQDTDGQTKDIFSLLAAHGFNAIRLKTFVDPNAAYGYASKENSCAGFSEAYGDKAHVIAFGKQIKAANMQFLLDFHYSDTWADPGNQIIPEAWRGAANVAELADYVQAYTQDVIQAAVSAGARPDMVQIGNEITPGMLVHVPGANTDCWGNNPANASVNGSTARWGDLGTLLKAGIAGVREVDASIQIMLHVENTDDLNGVQRWVDNALAQGVDFDVLGLSCYAAFQGNPSVWENTLTKLATKYPDLKFAIAEYNPERTRANQIVKDLPNNQGVGTFFWEPTRSGEWGDSLFTQQGNTMTAKNADFAEFDALRDELGL